MLFDLHLVLRFLSAWVDGKTQISLPKPRSQALSSLPPLVVGRKTKFLLTTKVGEKREPGNEVEFALGLKKQKLPSCKIESPFTMVTS